jgi:hypothetical protein
MSRNRALVDAALVAVGFCLAAGVNAQQVQPATTTTKAAKSTKPAAKSAAPELVKEQRALDLLKAMSARLAAAPSMMFTAVVTYEFPSLLGPAIAYTTQYEVTMQRPDRLRVITLGDGPASEFY